MLENDKYHAAKFILHFYKKNQKKSRRLVLVENFRFSREESKSGLVEPKHLHTDSFSLI